MLQFDYDIKDYKYNTEKTFPLNLDNGFCHTKNLSYLILKGILRKKPIHLKKTNGLH